MSDEAKLKRQLGNALGDLKAVRHELGEQRERYQGMLARVNELLAELTETRRRAGAPAEDLKRREAELAEVAAILDKGAVPCRLPIPGGGSRELTPGERVKVVVVQASNMFARIRSLEGELAARKTALVDAGGNPIIRSKG